MHRRWLSITPGNALKHGTHASTRDGSWQDTDWAACLFTVLRLSSAAALPLGGGGGGGGGVAGTTRGVGQRQVSRLENWR